MRATRDAHAQRRPRHRAAGAERPPRATRAEPTARRSGLRAVSGRRGIVRRSPRRIPRLHIVPESASEPEPSRRRSAQPFARCARAAHPAGARRHRDRRARRTRTLRRRARRGCASRPARHRLRARHRTLRAALRPDRAGGLGRRRSASSASRRRRSRPRSASTRSSPTSRGRGSSTRSTPAAPATRPPRARPPRSLSTGFGELAGAGRRRADRTAGLVDPARTPTSRAHVEGWGELLCMLAGLPPASEGVSLLSSRRAGAWLSRRPRRRPGDPSAEPEPPSQRRTCPSRSSTTARATSPPSPRSPRAPVRSRSTPSAHPASATRSAPTSSRSSAAGAGTFLFDPARRSARLHRARRRDGGRGVDPARREPGPRLPARGRASIPSAIFDTELGARLAGPAARRPRRRRRGAARHPPRQGALGRRLVDPPAAPGLARLRRARRRAARPTCATRSPSCSTSTARPRSRAQEFDAVLERETVVVRQEPWRRLSRHARPAQRAQPRRRPRTVDRARRLRPRDRHRARPARARRLARRRRARAARDQARPRRHQGVHRAREPQRSSTAGGTRSRRGIADRRTCPSLRVPRRRDPPAPASGSEKNPEADRRLKRARAAVTDARPRSSTSRSRTCSPPSTLRRVAWTPPEPMTAGGRRRCPASARRAPVAALTQPHS